MDFLWPLPLVRANEKRSEITDRYFSFPAILVVDPSSRLRSPLQKRDNGIPLITIEYNSVSVIFQQDSVVF